MGRERKAGEKQSVWLPFLCPLPWPCYGRQRGAAGLATACCWAARGADGGSPVLWLGLIQTLPRPLTPSGLW